MFLPLEMEELEINLKTGRSKVFFKKACIIPVFLFVKISLPLGLFPLVLLFSYSEREIACRRYVYCLVDRRKEKGN